MTLEPGKRGYKSGLHRLRVILPRPHPWGPRWARLSRVGLQACLAWRARLRRDGRPGGLPYSTPAGLLFVGAVSDSGGRGLFHAANLFQFRCQRLYWFAQKPLQRNGFLSQRLGLIELAQSRQRQSRIHASPRTAPTEIRAQQIGDGYGLAEQRQGAGGVAGGLIDAGRGLQIAEVRLAGIAAEPLLQLQKFPRRSIRPLPLRVKTLKIDFHSQRRRL